MEIVRFILIVVEIISCMLLIGVILLQQSKSQGMGVAFGGGMGETLFGSRAGNILTKITITLAIVFLANTTLLGIMYTSGGEATSLVERAPIPAPAPSSGPVQGGDMVPPPTQRGTMMTSGDETPAPAAQAQSVETVEGTASVVDTVPVTGQAQEPAPANPEAEPVTP